MCNSVACPLSGFQLGVVCVQALLHMWKLEVVDTCMAMEYTLQHQARAWDWQGGSGL
jgi:hypothetical protein